MATDQVYVATESGSAEHAKTGETAVFVKGQTLVAEGHWLLDQCAHCFAPAENKVHYSVESATAEPGEKRGSKAKAG